MANEEKNIVENEETAEVKKEAKKVPTLFYSVKKCPKNRVRTT